MSSKEKIFFVVLLAMNYRTTCIVTLTDDNIIVNQADRHSLQDEPAEVAGLVRYADKTNKSVLYGST